MFFGLFSDTKKAKKKKKRKKQTTIVNPEIEQQLIAARKKAKEAEDKHDQSQEETGEATARLYLETIDLSGSSLQRILEDPDGEEA